jgi:ATP-dependent helicase/nuclease subunit A
MSVTLTQEQSEVVENRGGELLVSAAAGSGKTRVLIERLLKRVMEDGCNLTDFLVITYTKAAANELRIKIMDAIRDRLVADPLNQHLRRQLNLIYQAQISTIHAFCTALLRESGHLLDLDPDFRIADENEAALLRLSVLERVLEDRYECIDSNGFAVLVDTFSAGRDDSRLKEIVLDIQGRVQSHPHPEAWLRKQAAAFDLRGVKDVGQTEWGKLLLQDSVELADYWRRRLSATLDWMEDDPVTEKNYGDSIRTTMDELDNFMMAAEHGWDRAAALADISFPRVGTARKGVDPIIKEQVKNVRDKCKKEIAVLAERFSSTSAELLAEMEATRPAVEQLIALELDYMNAFQAEKRKRKLLDFGDLEHLAVAALTDGKGNPSELAKEWQQRYVEVMVDEYQDTNEVQNAIFDAVTDGGRNLFQVGDIKQSIYRFRLADPRIFLRKYHTFAPGRYARTGEPRRLVLTRNFRSRASVLHSVNFVFEQIMSDQFGDVNYVDDQKLVPALPYPDYDGDHTELNVLDLSSIEQDEHAAKEPSALVEARFVAKRIRELLDEPHLVTEGDHMRPVRPEDIAILHRSLNQVYAFLTTALDEQNIPWQSTAEEDIFETTEVQIALSFLEVINNPRDDVQLISVLRSPVYHFTPDELALLRAECRDGDYYTCVKQGAEAGNEHCLAFLSDLELLRTAAPDRNCAEILWDVYDRVGLFGLVGAMTGGERRQQNLLAFYDYARGFEENGHRGLFQFVTRLRKLLNSGEKRPGGYHNPATGVQLMTIHHSKGLEYPVVFLTGLSRGMNLSDQNKPMLFHPTLGIGPKALDRKNHVEYPTLARSAIRLQLERENKSEELRLLYVAMTRAREKLVLVMTFDNASKEIASLMPDAGPHPDPRALLRLNSMGKWLLLPVLARHDAKALHTTSQPEEHLLSDTPWDIRFVQIKKEQLTAAAAQQEADCAAVEAPPNLTECLQWQYPYAQLVNLPSKVTATQLKGRELDREVAEETPLPAAPLEFRRPNFEQKARGLTPAERGTATHLVMQLIDPAHATSEEGVEQELERLVSQHYMSEAQAKAISRHYITAFWRSNLGREAANAPTLKREWKFSILTEAQRCYPEAPAGEQLLLQGVIDCCFLTEEGYTVIDFKTDRVAPGQEELRAEQYRSQLEIYTSALTEMTGQPVARRILWFFATGTAVEL